MEAKEKHLPCKMVKFDKHKHRKSKWITQGILNSICFRDDLHLKLKKAATGSAIHDSYKRNLSTYNVILRKSIRSAKKQYYENLFQKYKNDIRKTWSTINNILHKNKKNKKFPEYFKGNDENITNKLEIANKFNMFFTNIGPDLANEIKVNSNLQFHNFLKNKHNFSFQFKDVTEETVGEIIDKLKPKTSFGWDGLSMKLVKHTKIDLLVPVTAIINQMLFSGIFPDSLKIARVIPLHKKDDNTVFTNYRPISLLPVFSKIFEKVIFIQLYKYLNSNKLLYSSQYGFREGHSTEFAALEMIDRVVQQMDNDEIPINIFLDLSKAFDTLDHKILLHKLKHYGIKDKSLKLFQSYLFDRKQFVEYDGTKSDTLSITTGVPQGSVLGPLLFIIYVNDIAFASNIFKMVVYADDTTLSSTLTTCNITKANRYDNRCINHELEKINMWFKLNKLSLNASKSKYMIFHAYQRPIDHIVIKMNDIVIEKVQNFNFLGIMVNEHLDWKVHGDHISNKISKSVGIINRLKHFIPLNVKLMLYNSLILSYLNYGILCWGYKCGDRLIKLQKKAVRVMTLSKYNAHTEPILKVLNILKISDILKLQELKFYYKWVNNSVPRYFHSMDLRTNKERCGYGTRGGYSWFRNRTNRVYASRCLRNNISDVLNHTPSIIKDKVCTHSLNGFAKYIKHSYVESYEMMCKIENCYICKRNGIPSNHHV